MNPVTRIVVLAATASFIVALGTFAVFAQVPVPPGPPAQAANPQLDNCVSQFGIVRGYLSSDEQRIIQLDSALNHANAEVADLKKQIEELKKPKAPEAPHE